MHGFFYDLLWNINRIFTLTLGVSVDKRTEIIPSEPVGVMAEREKPNLASGVSLFTASSLSLKLD